MTLFADTYSRFQTTKTTLQDGEEVWGTWDRQSFLSGDIPQDQQQSIMVVSDRAGRPDLISFDLYGTTRLDWLLIAFNDAYGVFNWPRTGTVITAPITDIVLGEVL